LSAVRVKIGYPDRWRDYSALRLKDDSLAGNIMRANTFEWRRNLAKLGRPIDRSEWFTSPSTVNAYYNPYWNEIMFPAAILQRGFYDPKADDASNYGAIGTVIGHEITHGFDDQGAQYDLTGLRRDWWTKADKARYDEKGQAIVAQYNGYKSPSGYAVNGALTEGENIADVGGVMIAYLAYRKSLNGVEPPIRDGLTGDQRFFVALAQNYRAKFRPEFEKMLSSLDTHSPNSVRAVGAAADLPAFYRAFGLPVPENLPSVW
ncbi:M13 family peptidase, partial [bacterium]